MHAHACVHTYTHMGSLAFTQLHDQLLTPCDLGVQEISSWCFTCMAALQFLGQRLGHLHTLSFASGLNPNPQPPPALLAFLPNKKSNSFRPISLPVHFLHSIFLPHLCYNPSRPTCPARLCDSFPCPPEPALLLPVVWSHCDLVVSEQIAKPLWMPLYPANGATLQRTEWGGNRLISPLITPSLQVLSTLLNQALRKVLMPSWRQETGDRGVSKRSGGRAMITTQGQVPKVSSEQPCLWRAAHFCPARQTERECSGL